MTPLERAWIAYGGTLPTGRSNKANCPLHDDRTASASVDVERGKWRCFAGCGHGDIYDLIGLAERTPEFHQQKQIAEEKFGDSNDWGARSLVARKSKGRKGAWKPPWLR